jgi:hypothetical protein
LKKTAGPQEILQVLQTLSKISQTTELIDEGMNQQEARELFQLIIRSFNRMLHRCASSQECLWPLCPADVLFIAQHWYSELSWPTFPDSSWSNAGDLISSKVLIVDDSEAFHTFKSNIESAYAGDILYLDYCSSISGSSTISSSDAAQVKPDSDTSLDKFSENHHHLLSQSIEYFVDAVTRDQPQSDPTCMLWSMCNNSFCLTDLINKSLSVSTEVHQDYSELLGKVKTSNRNIWLTILSFLKSKYFNRYNALQGIGDFRSFRAMNFTVVEELSDRRSLNLTSFLHNGEKVDTSHVVNRNGNQNIFTKDEPKDYKLREIGRVGKKYEILINAAISSKGLAALHKYLVDSIFSMYLHFMTPEEQEKLRECITLTKKQPEIDKVSFENHRIMWMLLLTWCCVIFYYQLF